MTRLRVSNPEIWKRDALVLLAEEGCPVCVRLIREIPRHFFWFVNEHYYEIETVQELRRSYGFCPSHTRDLLHTGSSSVITTVFGYLTEYAISRLQRAEAILKRAKSGLDGPLVCRRAAETLRSHGICRACRDLDWQAKHMISALLHSMADPEVRKAYQNSTGLCLPHFRQAGRLADWDGLCFLAAQIRERLMSMTFSDATCTGQLEIAAGLIPGGSVGRKYPQGEETGFSEMPGDPRPRSWSPTLEWIRAKLHEPGCPVCNACTRGLGRCFYWLAQELKSVRSPQDYWDTSWRLCPSHSWELRACGQERAAALTARHIIQEWLWGLDDLLPAMADRPSHRLMDRMAAAVKKLGPWSVAAKKEAAGIGGSLLKLLESPASKLDGLRSVAFREDPCQACVHARSTTHRTLDLLLRVVEDPAGREAYVRGSGLCLRHCVTASALAESPTALSVLIVAQITRLRLLQWELEESSRKLNWSVRYEPKGPEQSAWLRAAQMFCGVGIGGG